MSEITDDYNKIGECRKKREEIGSYNNPYFVEGETKEQRQQLWRECGKEIDRIMAKYEDVLDRLGIEQGYDSNDVEDFMQFAAEVIRLEQKT